MIICFSFAIFNLFEIQCMFVRLKNSQGPSLTSIVILKFFLELIVEGEYLNNLQLSIFEDMLSVLLMKCLVFVISFYVLGLLYGQMNGCLPLL